MISPRTKEQNFKKGTKYILCDPTQHRIPKSKITNCIYTFYIATSKSTIFIQSNVRKKKQTTRTFQTYLVDPHFNNGLSVHQMPSISNNTLDYYDIWVLLVYKNNLPQNRAEKNLNPSYIRITSQKRTKLSLHSHYSHDDCDSSIDTTIYYGK